MATLPPPKAAPPAKGLPPAIAMRTTSDKKWNVSSGQRVTAQKVVLYGPGGIGKTELAANSAAVGMRPLFIDLESGTQFCNVARIEDVDSFGDLRDLLHSDSVFAAHDMVVIDSLTKAQELCEADVIANVPVDDTGKRATSLESWGWGKGQTYVYERFLLILNDLDALHRAGKTIVGICHDCTANVPNPGGIDWIRYEPRLQSPASGKASIRLRVREWCDHLLYIGYDVAVSKTGKATGGGTRCIYPTEMPTHMAKSRKLSQPIVYAAGSADLWNLLKVSGS